ncbi:hypothetical protein B4U79_03715 [Dinothrombium tinctorium]|uniref:Large subunit GTPase 1 homolog n=1 Tax=Dinothrombium tinctorium TaxID=1965070 RepID=A0A3S3QSJ8_9ACAR|nr:hypothetical protein B4U79_00332 [Dinothrombium tinctorium]RWS13333.1 hypothetical protein B4U79_10476 [Dinothrombium tinctorium]RWS13603.1 hypothetical protein B4U79_08788 [Dinothrombium tinctorium]RWS13665.1 hypothetical protein B4U79_03715 [Dinothrombium tinctorium]
MPSKKKANASSLGRRLIKTQESRRNQLPSKQSNRHTVDLNEGEDWSKLNLRSVTEESSLAEFLSTAELAGTQFKAERENVRLVNPRQTDRSDGDERSKLDEEDIKNLILVPRRPEWNSNMSPDELSELEYQSFLNWRRQLAEYEQRENVVMTPFERNLEFWRQLWRVLERSDVVVQILDARNPLLFLSEDLNKYVKEIDENKKIVLLLNKSDYLTEDQRKIWAQYFDQINVKIVFFSAIQETEREDKEEADGDIEKNFESLSLTQNSSRIMNRDQLISFFKSFKNANLEMITIGFVGYPNVGKSSTINAILMSKKVSVSATPGKTKHFQTLNIDDELCLCDCPGLVFPKFVSSKAEMIINGILPVDQMTDHRPPMDLIVSLIPKHVFESTYSIRLPQNDEKLLTGEDVASVYGLMRGFMTQRGLPDTARAARYIIKDFILGRLLVCFAPPSVNQNEFHLFHTSEEKIQDTSYENISSQQKRLMGLSRTVNEDEFNREFFKQRNGGVHTKGVQGVSTFSRQMATALQNGEISPGFMRPPKKHFNRNKKQKLKKVYGSMDVW